MRGNPPPKKNLQMFGGKKPQKKTLQMFGGKNPQKKNLQMFGVLPFINLQNNA